MKVNQTKLEGVLLIQPIVHRDGRGFFMETFQKARYAEAGIPTSFAQDNVSFSIKGTLRGLHFQIKQPQSKLVQALSGEIFDVVVDVRPGSPTFAQWEGFILSDRNGYQLFIPEGFAHGLCVLSETAHFLYKCNTYYSSADEGGILWSDPDIGIQWPVADPIISPKDGNQPLLRELGPKDLPQTEKIH